MLEKEHAIVRGFSLCVTRKNVSSSFVKEMIASTVGRLNFVCYVNTFFNELNCGRLAIIFVFCWGFCQTTVLSVADVKGRAKNNLKMNLPILGVLEIAPRRRRHISSAGGV